MEDNLLHAKQYQCQGDAMFSLKVSGMTCGGCINAVTKAVQSQDPQAKVQADLATQTVSLDTSLSQEEASKLITDAGFPVFN